jgi:hypothetical protein
MTRLKDLIAEKPVHERRLEIRTYPAEEGRLIVEGWLRDERLRDGFHWNGGPRPAGVVHWICVRLLVGGWPLSILDAEAEMQKVPHELCPETLDSVRKLVGLSIVSGYSEAVRDRLGGVQGCAHMTHLITAMGPAALHGYWAQRTRKRPPIPDSLDDLPGLRYLVDSCQLWGKDGPLMKELRAALGKPEGKP